MHSSLLLSERSAAFIRFAGAIFAAAALAPPLPSRTGPVLDDLLNYAVVDQRCPAQASNEGLSLAGHGKATSLPLSKEQPLGQTFRVGPKAAKLWRVCVALCWYPDNWREGEAVTFTLWDSPAKKRKLYSRVIDFEHKWFKWDVPFDVMIPTKPNAEYYFELTHNGGGDDSIQVVTVPGNDYKRGQAYVAGNPRHDLDLYFVVVSKPKGDRIANLKRFLSGFDFSYPPLVEAGRAFRRGDYDRACKLILRHFDNRTKPDSLVPKPIPREKIDTTRLDKVCDEGRLYSKDGAWIEMSRQTTWREVWPDSPSYVRQNDLFRELGQAYQATGNEKYARKLNELMADFIQDNASPYEGGMRGGRWVAMFIAWRTGDAWDGYGAACQSKSLTNDVKLGWIDYWRRMGRFVELEPSGGNQENASAECLMDFGFRFPEYADSHRWSQHGFERLMRNSLALFREDGGSTEPTMNYQGYALGFLTDGLETAKKRGLKVPAEIMPRLEKIYEYIAYILYPNGQAPSNGDTDCEEFRTGVRPYQGWRTGQCMRGAEMFRREDFRYIATAGKQGKKPESASRLFPNSRYAVMRSDWGGPNGEDFEQARYLLFRGGYPGGHGHHDFNQVTLYGYGRSLIIDPGRTAYGTPLMSELQKNRSHNVLLVDDLPMNEPDPTLHAWRTNPVLDFIDNSYKELYLGVDHRRAVVFVKPDYFVVFDRAASKDAHRYGLNFWLTPPEVTIDRKAGTVRTNDPHGANVLLAAADPAKIDIAERKGTLELAKQIRSDIPVVTFWQNGKTDAEFATLLYPFPNGADPRPLRITQTVVGKGVFCSVTTPKGVDSVFYDPNGQSPGVSLIRTDGNGAVLRFAIAGLSSLKWAEETLVSSANPIGDLSVVYTPDAVEITCAKPEPSLQVAALGRTRAVVNGRPMAVRGEMFRVFP